MTGCPEGEPETARSARVSSASSLDETEPSGKTHLSVVGVPALSGRVPGSSASAGVHDRHLLIMAGERDSNTRRVLLFAEVILSVLTIGRPGPLVVCVRSRNVEKLHETIRAPPVGNHTSSRAATYV